METKRKTIHDGDVIERGGHRFRVTVEHDYDAEEPWSREDGRGPVIDWTTRPKLPGERVLKKDRGRACYYDFQEAVRIARRDGWDTEPYGQGTRGQRAARAAEADFRRMKAWCDDEWRYVGVVVRRACPCCGSFKAGDYEFALWGVEDDDPGYLTEVAEELIADALGELAATPA